GETAEPVKAGDPVLPPPQGSAFDPAGAPQGEDRFALAVLRAMIAAANADGHIDEDERQRISGKLQESGIDREAADFIDAELANPPSLEAIAASAASDPQK